MYSVEFPGENEAKFSSGIIFVASILLVVAFLQSNVSPLSISSHNSRYLSANPLPKNSQMLENATAIYGSSFQNITVKSSFNSGAFDPINGNVYLFSLNAQSLSVLNSTTNKLITTLSLSPATGSSTSVKVAFNPFNQEIEVLTFSRLYIINTSSNSISKYITVYPFSVDLAINPISGDSYILYDTNITDLNGTSYHERVLFSLPSSWLMSALAYSPEKNDLYVSGTNEVNYTFEDRTLVINASNGSLVTSINVGGLASALYYDSNSGIVYGETPNDLFAFGSTNYSIIDNALIDVGGISSFFIDQEENLLLATTIVNFSIYAFSLSHFKMSYSISLNNQTSGVGLLFDPLTNAIYISLNKQTVSIVHTGYSEFVRSAAFIENGLTPDSEWNISLGGMTMHAMKQFATFFVLNGAYAFEVNPVQGMHAFPQNGVVNDTESNSTSSIIFAAEYSLTINEKGLNNGTNWTVRLNESYTSAGFKILNNPLNYSSTSKLIRLNLTNGTYTFNAYPVGNLKPEPESGQIKISGLNVTLNLNWSRPPLRNITFPLYYIALLASYIALLVLIFVILFSKSRKRKRVK